MSSVDEKEETQVNYHFGEYSISKHYPELLKCGEMFLCSISDDFVFFCGLCEENTHCKYTIFDEFANHIKEHQIMPSKEKNTSDEPLYLELQHKKESAEHQELPQFETEYLSCSEEVEKNSDGDSLNEQMEFSFDEPIIQPKLFVLDWPEHQVLQFIDLYRKQECLWNAKCKQHHKGKVKEDAYKQILQKFNEVNPNVLQDISSVKNAIKELNDFFNDFVEQSQERTEVSSNLEIYKKLLFSKNVSKLTPVQLMETTSTYTCDELQNDLIEFESDIKAQNSKDMNNLSTDTLPSLTDGKNCPVCRVSFESSKDLEIHLSDLCTNLQKKICDICGANFKDSRNLITHLKSHTPEICEVCTLSFSTSTELEAHVLEHINEKQLLCETCGLQFRYPNRLETHRLLHGDPSFECKDCNQKFLLKRQLAYHQRIHGPTIMVSCDVCKKMYRNKDSLLRHKRKIHNIKRRAYKKTQVH